MQDPNQLQSAVNTGGGGWSTLWDKAETISAHTQKGIEFLDKFGQFLKERAAIEEEYAGRIRSLVKKTRGKKNDEDEVKMYSYLFAFNSMLGELDSLAAQHEVIGEKLRKEVVPTITEKTHVLRAGRKKHLGSFHALNAQKQETAENMQKMHKLYLKAFHEAEIAYLKHDKADKNMDLSRSEVERAKNNVHQKNQICEQAKQGYGHALEMANRTKNEHYQIKMPNLLEDMRRLDIDRIESTKSAMMASIQAETSVANIVKRCYDDMGVAVSSINPDEDTAAVVVRYSSGWSFPTDFVFEDLGCPSNILHSNGESAVDSGGTLKRNTISAAGGLKIKNANGKSIPRKHSMHQRLFGGTSNTKSHNGDADGYADLPPQQRCRQIENKLNGLAKEAATKEQSRAGLEKMLGVYRDNPKMGNAADVERQILQVSKELEGLAEKIERYKRMLLDAQSELNTPLGGATSMDGGSHNQLRSASSYAGGSPNLSPRVNSSTTSLMSTGTSGGGFPAPNQQRSSCSEESVSSSEGSSSVTQHSHGNTGLLRTSLNSTQSILSNGFTPKGKLNNNFVSASSSLPPSGATNTSIQHIDSNSGDFYEECDTPNGKSNGFHNNHNGHHQDGRTMSPPSAAVSADGSQPPVLGTCTALYAFEGNSDGSTIALREGDELLLVERDEGDGWTRVRQIGGCGDSPAVEGFVPTSYLQCRWYPTA